MIILSLKNFMGEINLKTDVMNENHLKNLELSYIS